MPLPWLGLPPRFPWSHFPSSYPFFWCLPWMQGSLPTYPLDYLGLTNPVADDGQAWHPLQTPKPSYPWTSDVSLDVRSTDLLTGHWKWALLSLLQTCPSSPVSLWGERPEPLVCFSLSPSATHRTSQHLLFLLFECCSDFFLHPLPNSGHGHNMLGRPGSLKWPPQWCKPPGTSVPTATARLIFFLNKCIHVFVFIFLAVLGLRCCTQDFSSCSERGLLFVAVSGPLTVVASRCRAPAPERRLRSCGTWAQ